MSLALILAALFVGMANHAQAQDLFIKANGIDVRAGHGTGQIVALRGVNLGSLFVYEPWMSPMNSAATPGDQWSVEDTLTQRFGAANKDALINAWRDSWMGSIDYQYLAQRGMNCIRVPLWYGVFEDDAGNPRADAFTRLDNIINTAWANGIYTIIDLHGAYGGQSGADSTTSGRKQANPPFWNNDTTMNPSGDAWNPYNVYIQRTENLWARIAQHYNGNPAVAAYDLLNEPVGAPNRWALMNVYNRLYSKIRTVDVDHLIMMEGTWGGWDWDNNGAWSYIGWGWGVLQRPADRGWTNVIYSFHHYDSGRPAVDGTVNDFVAHQSWNVPCHIGEFNTFGDNDAFIYAVDQFNSKRMSWAMWSYKATHGSATDSWGIYNLASNSTLWNNKPDLNTESYSNILSKWSSFTTANFITNTDLALVFKSPVPASGSYYKVTAKHSSKVLQVASSSQADGAQIQQGSVAGNGNGTANQNWRIEYMGGGFYRLTARHSGKVLDVNAASTADGAKVQQWTSGGNASSSPTNQRWLIEDMGGGWCRITAEHSHKVLDVAGSSTAKNAIVQQWTDSIANNQLWKLQQVP